MKRLKPLIILTVFAMLLSTSGVANAITFANRDELNNATPGTQKAGLGTILRSHIATGVVVLETGDTSSSSAQTINITAEPSGDTGYVRKFTGSGGGDSLALQDGSVGQVVTFALVNDGGQNWVITPDTSSGFDDVTFSDSGDNATLKFIDSSVGWIVVGTADTTSGPVLSAPVNPFN